MHLNSDDSIASIIKENEIIETIAKRIDESNEIVVLGHVEPDGDCIGAQLALSGALKALGKRVTAVNSGPYEQSYASNYESYFSKELKAGYDLAFVVDTSNKERIGLPDINKLDYSKTIIIDHHATNDNCGVLNWVESDFVSSSEMIFLLIYRLKKELIVGDTAQFLLNGILSDNGYFQHIRKNKHFSLLASYFLVNCGADPKRAYDEMFANSSINIEKLTAVVLGRIEEHFDGKVLWTYITEEDKESFATDVQSLKIFKVMMNIKNSSIYVLFKVDKAANQVVVSLRSIDRHNVSQVAAKFGGGGHRVAAGVTMQGSFADVKAQLLDEIGLLLAEES